ncbi:hypothetical protein EJ110_NYTH26064 [Nymphaea thermarum]|nr:hypothetical protein EJ110_NYTH26064 [Nymphaea thermarum]
MASMSPQQANSLRWTNMCQEATTTVTEKRKKKKKKGKERPPSNSVRIKEQHVGNKKANICAHQRSDPFFLLLRVTGIGDLPVWYEAGMVKFDLAHEHCLLFN